MKITKEPTSAQSSAQVRAGRKTRSILKLQNWALNRLEDLTLKRMKKAQKK